MAKPPGLTKKKGHEVILVVGEQDQDFSDQLAGSDAIDQTPHFCKYEICIKIKF